MTKRELIEELVRLTQLQSKALTEDNVDGFMALLIKRQRILDQIGELHESQPETKEQHEEELVSILRTLDERNQIEFKKKFEEVKRELKEIRQMKNMENKYTNTYNTSWNEGVYFDKREKR